MAVQELPLQSQIDRSSGPKAVGFDVIEVKYSSKVSQRSFDGPSQEASRNETWTVRWKLLERLTPQQEVAQGRDSTFDTIKNFYENNYLGRVEWKPFELETIRIWEIVPNSFRQTNSAGCIFDVKFDIRFLYNKF